ncbi:MAG: SURF1 family protein [Gammaproteobacteria bacterium]|nr:SURF1 family protein [Gammaproteobacteria bacterium]
MKIKLFMFWLCFVALFVALGYWQLCRYQFKKDLLNDSKERLISAPVALKSVTKNPLEFQHVIVAGRYLNDEIILVQDQFFHHRLGFEVLTVFQIPNESEYLLVDRGWVPVLENGQLPVISPVKNEQRLIGHLRTFHEYQFILGKNILNPTVKPLVIQKVDVPELSHVLNKPLYPFILRLDANMPNGFAREWVITTVLPERHLGYAVQWFLMAIVLLIASIYFCFVIPRRF